MPVLYGNTSKVRELSPENFIRLPNGQITLRNVDKDKVGFVMFYADWCGHCIHAVPAYKELADVLGNTAFVGAFNSANKAPHYKEISDAVGVRSYPTIKFLKHGILFPYEGSREVKSFLEFLCKYSSQFCKY